MPHVVTVWAWGTLLWALAAFWGHWKTCPMHRVPHMAKGTHLIFTEKVITAQNLACSRCPFLLIHMGSSSTFFSSFQSLWQTTYMWVDLNNRNFSPHSSGWKSKLKVQTSLTFPQHCGEICLLLHSELSGLFASSICFALPLPPCLPLSTCKALCLCACVQVSFW